MKSLSGLEVEQCYRLHELTSLQRIAFVYYFW